MKAVELRGISKRFGDVVALDNVDFSVEVGEVHGLLGENGAGKTTLMNILYGLYKPDSGKIFIMGEEVKISSPLDSIKLGIGMIHQISTLVPEFTVIENIVLGDKSLGTFKFDVKLARKKVKELADSIGFELPFDKKVKELPPGVKQKTEIVRALYREAKILILDEPTAYLVGDEFDQLLKAINILKEKGVTIIFITHKIREVFQACDRVTVLKGGRVQGSLDVRKASEDELVSLMFEGQKIEVTDSALPKMVLEDVEKTKSPILKMINVSTNVPNLKNLKNVNLEVYGGEILGIAGISGHGQKLLTEVVVNPNLLHSGDILINGESTKEKSTVDILKSGVFFTPEDRVLEGSLPTASIYKNIFLGHHREERFLKGKSVVVWRKVRSVSRELIKLFKVKTPNEVIEIRKLSGGNMQKVIFARAFLNPIDLLVTHNPTAGLDMASVKFVFEKLLEMRKSRKAVLYINEDLDELMAVSDRIAVIRNGQIVKVFQREEFNKREIGKYMAGVVE